METLWKYLVVSLILKVPVNENDGGNSEKMAYDLLNKQIHKISPAYLHEIIGPKKVELESLVKKTNLCSTEQRDCGNCEG